VSFVAGRERLDGVLDDIVGALGLRAPASRSRRAS